MPNPFAFDERNNEHWLKVANDLALNSALYDDAPIDHDTVNRAAVDRALWHLLVNGKLEARRLA